MAELEQDSNEIAHAIRNSQTTTGAMLPPAEGREEELAPRETHANQSKFIKSKSHKVDGTGRVPSKTPSVTLEVNVNVVDEHGATTHGAKGNKPKLLHRKISSSTVGNAKKNPKMLHKKSQKSTKNLTPRDGESQRIEEENDTDHSDVKPPRQLPHSYTVADASARLLDDVADLKKPIHSSINPAAPPERPPKQCQNQEVADAGHAETEEDEEVCDPIPAVQAKKSRGSGGSSGKKIRRTVPKSHTTPQLQPRPQENMSPSSQAQEDESPPSSPEPKAQEITTKEHCPMEVSRMRACESAEALQDLQHGQQIYQGASGRSPRPSLQQEQGERKNSSGSHSSSSSSEGPGAIVIGVTGISRSGKGYVSKALLRAIESTGKKAIIVGQDDFWHQACQVKIRGQIRTSEDEPECINYEHFAAAIQDKMESNDIVIAEGFHLLQHKSVASLLNYIYLLKLDRDEARRRRTQPKDNKHNPNPLSQEDFDELHWPSFERYMKEKVEPLGKRVVQLECPTNRIQRDEHVTRIMQSAGLTVKTAGGRTSRVSSSDLIIPEPSKPSNRKPTTGTFAGV
jgi:uridine kinase